MSVAEFVREKLANLKFGNGFAEKASAAKAIQWIKDNRLPNSGIRANSKAKVATPEVTGYIIPTLFNYGEKDLAFDLTRWEVSVQKPDGSFAAPGSDVSYTFDTAQIARGFLAVLDDMPEVENNLRRACDYVDGQIDKEGRVNTPSYATWKLADGTMLSEYGNLYVLPPMLEVGKKLNEKRYIEAAKRGMNYFRQKKDLVEFKSELGMLSHYFGYMMEALVDLGEIELAKQGLEQAKSLQKP